MNELYHYGIPKQKWGVRRFQNPDGSLTPEGRARYLGEPISRKNQTVFVSGSSKTQDKSSGYYLKKLPYSVRYELKEHMKRGDKIIVGDAPGIDRQTQDYLAKKKYTNVEVFSPGKEGARYLANPGWKQTNVDKPGAEIGSKEWLAAKDFVMSNLADKGIAVTIDEGAKATRKNVDRLVEANKEVMVYEIGRDRGRLGNLLGLRDNKATTFINGKEVSEGYYDGYWVNDPQNRLGNVPEHEYGTRTKEIASAKIKDEDRRATNKMLSEKLRKDPNGLVYDRTMSVKENAEWQSEHEGRKVTDDEYRRRLKSVGINPELYNKERSEWSSRGSMMDIVSQDKKNWRVTTDKKGERGAEYIGPGKNVNSQVKSLRNAGYTYREIEQTLGVSSSKIAEILS